MSREITLEIAVNGAFLTRRWEQPENWVRLTKECGFSVQSFCADVLDPFFSGDESYRTETALAVKEYSKQYGVSFCDIYTGVATHRFHGMSHSDPRPRKRMVEWFEETAKIALQIGADIIGGHADTFSSEVLADIELTKATLLNQYKITRELAEKLTKIGLRAYTHEQMYMPSEKPWLISEADEFVVEVNKNTNNIPVYLTLDTGHMAGMHFGAGFPDTDYVEWTKRFASISEIFHIQQTTPEASHHWPFTKEYNAKGCVDIQKVLDTIVQSHKEHESRPFSFMKPVDKHYLVLECIPGSLKPDDKVLAELKESAEFLRQYIPEGGLKLSV